MSTWHATPHMLARYAIEPDRLDSVTAASLEAHLLDCDQCRRGVAVAVDPAALAESWDAVADRVDRPRRSFAERVLGMILADDVARVVAATPALRVSWLATAVAVIVAAVAVSRGTGNLTPFLVLAPLVPLAGVAASFGSAPDPAGDVALATPMHGAGLVLRRTVVVLATSLLVLLAGTAALPVLEWRAAAWILPAIALSVAALALSTWLHPVTSTVTAAVGWQVALIVAAFVDRMDRPLDDGSLFGPPGQVAFAVLITLALTVVGVRQPRFATMEAR